MSTTIFESHLVSSDGERLHFARAVSPTLLLVQRISDPSVLVAFVVPVTEIAPLGFRYRWARGEA